MPQPHTRLKRAANHVSKALGRVKDTILPPRKGRLISLDGIDGAGKSVLLDALMDSLRKKRIKFTKISMLPEGRIRELLLWDKTFTPLQRALLYKIEGDRVRVQVEALLKSRQLVICERSAYSFMAYQGFGEGLLPEIWKLGTMFDAFPTPDLAIFLDLPIEKMQERMAARQALDHFETKPPEFFNRVREGFLHVLPKGPSVIHIDATLRPEHIEAFVRGKVCDMWKSSAPVKTPKDLDSSL